MIVDIKPGKVSGAVSAPPSKSYAHRMLICSALTAGKSVIRGISGSEDMLATLDCINALGAKYEVDGDTVTVYGIRSNEALGASENFPCRESGSTMRFFLPLAMSQTEHALFSGTERLIERGIGVYDDIFSANNITVVKNASTIELSGKIKAGNYSIKGNISSQFITGLLLTLPLLDGNSTLTILPPVESRPYINITLEVIRSFGIIINQEGDKFSIPGNQIYQAMDTRVEGDWSNAAFLYALKHLSCPDNSIQINGLNFDSIQGDKVCLEMFDKLAGTSPENEILDISSCPDLGPILFAFAAANNGGHFTGTKRLRIKESDRAQAMAEELAKFGVELIVEENQVIVPASGLKAPTEQLSGHNDHRIVMSLAVLATLTGGSIDEAESVRKSYPDFFEVLQEINIKVNTH